MLKDTDLFRVCGVEGVDYAVRLFKGNPPAKLSPPLRRIVQAVEMSLLATDQASDANSPRT